MADRVKLTERHLQVLRAIADGNHISAKTLADCSWLERNGLIREVKTSFISFVSLRVTATGRAALSPAGEPKP